LPWIRGGFRRSSSGSFGLEQYEAVFRDNAIDDTVPLRLTADDVGIVGHRRKLLDTIGYRRSGDRANPASGMYHSLEDLACEVKGLSARNARTR
jgi:hypothetical protein